MKIYLFHPFKARDLAWQPCSIPSTEIKTSPTLAVEQEYISLVRNGAGEPLQDTEPVQRVQAKQSSA